MKIKIDEKGMIKLPQSFITAFGLGKGGWLEGVWDDEGIHLSPLYTKQFLNAPPAGRSFFQG